MQEQNQSQKLESFVSSYSNYTQQNQIDPPPEDLVEDLIILQRSILEDKPFIKKYDINKKISWSICTIPSKYDNLVVNLSHHYMVVNYPNNVLQDPVQYYSYIAVRSKIYRGCLMLYDANLFGKVFHRDDKEVYSIKDFESIENYTEKVRNYFHNVEIFNLYLDYVDKFEKHFKTLISEVIKPNF